jgi:hypothetical protein
LVVYVMATWCRSVGVWWWKEEVAVAIDKLGKVAVTIEEVRIEHGLKSKVTPTSGLKVKTKLFVRKFCILPSRHVLPMIDRCLQDKKKGDHAWTKKKASYRFSTSQVEPATGKVGMKCEGRII